MASLRIREGRYEDLAERIVGDLIAELRGVGRVEVVLGFRADLHEIELLDLFRITPGQIDGLKLASYIGRMLERASRAGRLPWGRWWSVTGISAPHDGAILRVELRGYALVED